MAAVVLTGGSSLILNYVQERVGSMMGVCFCVLGRIRIKDCLCLDCDWNGGWLPLNGWVLMLNIKGLKNVSYLSN